MTLLDEVDDGDIVYNRYAINFSICDYCSTQGRTISDLTIKSDSSPASILVEYNIGSKHTADEEGSKEGGIYNRNVGGCYCRRLTNGRICLKTTLLF